MIAAARLAPRARQNGFSLMIAVFTLVVLALLGTFMVTIGSVQRTTVVQALQAARAYQAARAGIEWGIHRALAGACAPLTGFALADAVLNGFQVNVNCASTPHREGTECFNTYQITSSAQLGTAGDPYFVSREISTTVTGTPVLVAPGDPCP